MKINELYEILKKLNESKGFYFNKDKELTFGVLEGLIRNKERYSYMSCPCRLATGDRKKDGDIICPCKYRTPDVNEYGACYCNLYVSSDWNDEKIKHVFVPERRVF